MKHMMWEDGYFYLVQACSYVSYLGIHRDPQPNPNSPLVRKAALRTAWSAFVIDRAASVASCQSPLLP
ncbi:hypothetical protein M427DRAFT_59435 [Gonapodya prolifera JEL478]|uniref:Transcription factor domain-containing protein n=1 Tax=Gonapodya prolifera (strain JEL478) TaxID=1344416 RepID=A0A139A767_GONPJ|nr:hypothetical protein M427DRAFT_59435 [Gonapodya prolifera JEL478]|eukprot:KXS12498.1 hypothetical protein M427DRAFT_59435 [Gonapodya prolifera JEL478]